MNSNIPYDTSWNYRLVSVPIMLFMVVFIAWASLSEIDEVVRGEGRVIPSSQTKVIQHLEGGIIDEILVKEGQSVVKGDVIYKLSQSFFQADLREKKIELYALIAQEIRLEAESKEKQKIQFSDELNKAIPHILENEKRLFKIDVESFNAQLALLQDELNKKEHELTERSNKFQNLSLELAIANENVTIAENLVRKGAASRKEYLTELAKKQNLYTQKQSIENSIPIIEEDIAVARSKMLTYRKSKHVEQFQEISKVRIAINKLLEKEKASDDRSVRKFIISPVNGLINKLEFHTVGGIIKPGDKVAEITPIDDVLMIEAHIKTNDRAKVYEGQSATIEITAFDYSRYGLLEGKLLGISPDSFTDNSGNSFYLARIMTNKSSFSDDEPILPGMIANVNILTGKKTILEYILKPLKDISKNSLSEQ